MSEQPVLRIDGLSVRYGRNLPLAVDGVSLHVRRGQTLGLVGESGSGKSTVGLAAVGLLPAESGTVHLDGHDLSGMRGAPLKAARSRASMVFQSSSASLDPRRSVGWSVAEPLLARGAGRRARTRATRDLLGDVGLPPDFAQRYPHELSGGQKQRVNLARALAAEPSLIVCDEPTSALDVSVQAQIVGLLLRLQQERGLAMVFITHDLAIVEAVSHDLAVLYDGRIVECGTAERVLRHPEHGYTQKLLRAVPGYAGSSSASSTRQESAR